MANKMLIDASHPEETRVVVLRGNRVEEFDFESASKKQLRGNIYLAKVTRVEPSLQAAFVEYGGNRHGFLAFSEIHPDYYQIPHADRQALLEEESRAHREEEDEDNGRRQNRRRSRRGAEKRRPQEDETLTAEVGADDLAAAPEGVIGGELAPSSETVIDAAPAEQANESQPQFGIDAPVETVSESLVVISPEAAPAPVAEQAAETHAIVADPEGFAVVAEPGFALESPAEAEAADARDEEDAQSREDEDAQAREFLAREQENDNRDHNHDDGDHHENGESEEEEIVEQLGGDAMDETPYRAPRLRRQ
jgi:ribonuclease E